MLKSVNTNIILVITFCFSGLLISCGGGGSDSPSAVVTPPTGTTPPPAPVGKTYEPFPPNAPKVDWFTDVSDASGITAKHIPITTAVPLELAKAAGAIVGDLDGDGLSDVIITTGNGPAKLYKNTGNLTFTDNTVRSQILQDKNAMGGALGDYDKDGDLDLILVGEYTAKLYQNDGTAVFTDVTNGSNITVNGSSVGALFADFDGDGWLDVLTLSYLLTENEFTDRNDKLYRNLGTGSVFEDISEQWQLGVATNTWVGAAIDADRDGKTDLFMGEDGLVIEGFTTLTDRIILNKGQSGSPVKTVTEDATVAMGIDEIRNTMGLVWSDFDEDGIDDLYISDAAGNTLYLGNAAGGYTKNNNTALFVTERNDSDCPPNTAGMSCKLIAWGANHSDFDLDGYKDLIVVNGHVEGDDPIQPVVLWRGLGSGNYEAVQSDLSWLAGHGLIAHDFDLDGDKDVIITDWNKAPKVFRNNTNSDGWLQVKLNGTNNGMGSRIEVTLSNGRVLTENVGYGGVVHSWADNMAHFGLGTQSVSAIKVIWQQGQVSNLTNVTANQILEIDEPIVTKRN